MQDAICIVKRAMQHQAVVGGGGAIEMELSRYLRHYALSIKGKQQLVVNAFAKALEVIPRQLAENAGFDSTDLLNKLRERHTRDGGCWFGIDIDNEDICDTVERFVWEPSVVKINALSAATEAACMVLSIDETIKTQQSEGLNDDRLAPAPRR